jgi:hypothetical protein
VGREVDVKIPILIPGTFPTPHAWASQMNLCVCLGRKYDIEVLISNDPGIHNGRNQLLLNGQKPTVDAVPWGKEYDKFLWLDSDVILSPEDAEKLIEADADIVSGLYPVGPGRTDIAVAGIDNPEIPFGERLRIGATMGMSDQVYPIMMEVDFVGFGCLAIRKGVFESMRFPWFDTLYETGQDGKVINLAEDFGFCRKAKKAGFKIHVHRKVRAWHEKLTVV